MSVRNVIAATSTAIETTVAAVPSAITKTAATVSIGFDILDQWIQDESTIQRETRQWRLDSRIAKEAESHADFCESFQEKNQDRKDLINSLLEQTSCSIRVG